MKWHGSSVAAAAVLLWLATGVAAHPKHEHRAMGTLSAIGEQEIEVETIDKETIEITTTDETIYERGGTAAARSDLQVGKRIVVFYTEDDEHVRRAVRILLPEGADTESGQP